MRTRLSTLVAHSASVLCLFGLLFSACADSETATVDITLYGESFVEERLDTDDKWTVTFDTFLVQIDSLSVGGQDIAPTPAVDLTEDSQGAGQTVASLTLPVGSYADLEFALHIASVSGTATKEGITKTFDWVFDQRTVYGACETQVIAASQGTSSTEITVHADHFFYDSLVSDAPAVLFQALADADANADGAISQAELSAAGLGAYDPGSTGTAENLWDWLLAQGQTLAHINGEGHCAQVR